MDLHVRLQELGLTLPAPSAALASYLPAVHHGSHLIVSGQLPLLDGHLMHEGAVGDTVSVEQAQACAKQCVINAIAAADRAIDGDWSTFERVLRVGVFVTSAPHFLEQHLVANGASDLLAEVFGETGRHARAAVGVPSLPLGAPVEVEVLFAVRG